jgi:hypothetical protein
MDYKSIKTFTDAYNALGLQSKETEDIINSLDQISRASAAAFKLNIIKRALNNGHELHPLKGDVYYPYVPISTEASLWYSSDLFDGGINPTGRFEYQGKRYIIYGGHAVNSGTSGLCKFNPQDGVAVADCNPAFLGCATREIAEHFGKYFGDIITEAKYGDLSDFKLL